MVFVLGFDKMAHHTLLIRWSLCMVPQITLFVFFVVMCYALGVALWALLRPEQRSTADAKNDRKGERSAREKRMAWALSWRIGIGLAIFAFLMLGYHAGWFHPHGLRLGQS